MTLKSFNHTCICRSTVVHSTSVPPREQPNLASSRGSQVTDDTSDNPGDSGAPRNVARIAQLPHRIPTGTYLIPKLSFKSHDSIPVVGSVLPYEHGGPKEPNDPRRLIRNHGFPPPPVIPPTCFNRVMANPTCSERNSVEAERLMMDWNPSRPVPDWVMDMGVHPFCQPRGAKADSTEDGMIVDANMLPPKPTYNGIAAAANMGAGVMQFGVARTK
ncbi:hypothetical protein B296_00029714 [Ensete ventricosum]|uniref:Uncharacterized protein n=1 Tax=Ensete ventricosum TaxID=4639 RepID=A0A427AKI9_ENSVE|nr:hypothetical protein B296_00029714 [Ensete ventricosum]